MSKSKISLAIAVVLGGGICCISPIFAQSGTTADPAQPTKASDSDKTEFASDDPGFKPMFTEDSFEGWVQLGGKAKYEIKDGSLREPVLRVNQIRLWQLGWTTRTSKWMLNSRLIRP